MTLVCLGCSTQYDTRPAWCWTCLSQGLFVEQGRRRAAAVDGEAQVATARELAAGAWDLVSIPAYDQLRLLRGALVLVYGAPGAGKSTMALRAGASMRGPQVYLAAEERLGPTLGERLQRLGVRSTDMHVVGRASVDQLVDLCRRVHARVLLIDSVSVGQWIPSDLRHLVQRLGLDALLAVQQATKDGTASGPNTWAHEADVVVHVDDGRWRTTKTRFQEPQEGTV